MQKGVPSWEISKSSALSKLKIPRFIQHPTLLQILLLLLTKSYYALINKIDTYQFFDHFLNNAKRLKETIET